ncbi:phosphonate metabolism transcriptional regulator PhnF [Vibrio hippocampi]|uniref:Transcriptional regulator PhnF n=1 Tax=Vibrio hippocampi TaxID=654686 RepID=A0ABN8DR87_9VIBR|nr:phosphonate metabolism transcriptional regulator PhnF [Vibrio hippocampi]CAH0530301.1 putative transcriptional regulator PhnF [Vibrio hippocampi]
MPVYLDIAQVLENEVKQQYQPGDYLPSEGQLAKRFEVNRHTLRRAIDELVTSGMVQRQQGKGNMVVRQPSEYRIHSGAHFTKNLLEQGARPRSEVISNRIIAAPTKIARHLGVTEGAKIIHIRTLRRTEDIPRTVIDHYLSQIEWWSILKNYQNGSLHEFIKRGLDIELIRKETRVGAKMPTNEECKLLQIDNTTPILKVNTKNLIKGTSVVAELSSSNSRSDATEILMEH